MILAIIQIIILLLTVYLVDRRLQPYFDSLEEEKYGKECKFYMDRETSKLYDNVFPYVAYDQTSAGFDIRSTEDAVVLPNERMIIPTGIYSQIPEGYEVQIRPRSGLAIKKGLTVLNSPGTIDSDYRGEWGVIVYNAGNSAITINKGDRIAQAVPKRNFGFSWIYVDSLQELEDSERGEGGFGSSGNE